MYKVGFGPTVEGTHEKEYFKQPFSSREVTKKALNEYSNKIGSALIGIDGALFTNNVDIIDVSTVEFEGTSILLDQGTDGVILNGVNDISKTKIITTNSIGIILGVADCAPIIGTSKKHQDIIFNLHGGYKGILGFNTNGLGIIESFVQKLKGENYNPKDISLDIGPMAGSNFELPESFIVPKIEIFLKNYPTLNSRDYFFLTTMQENRLGDFNLRQLILDVFKLHGFDKTSYASIDTTCITNSWPSFRNFSNGLQDENYRLTSTITKKVS